MRDVNFLVAFGAFAVAQIGLMIPITPGRPGHRGRRNDRIIEPPLESTPALRRQPTWCGGPRPSFPQIILGVVAIITWSPHKPFPPGKPGP